MGDGGWRGVGVRKKARKRFRSIRCGCEKGTFASKAVVGVFAVFATGRYTVTSVNVERKHVEWRAL